MYNFLIKGYKVYDNQAIFINILNHISIHYYTFLYYFIALSYRPSLLVYI